MLDSMRKASSGLVAKIMLGILALSFAVWGATDIFSGSSGNVLAKVGDVEITANQFSRRFQRDLFADQRTNKSQAQALRDGFGLRIYQTMVSEAMLDNQLKNMKVSLSHEQIAREIVNLPQYQTLDGKFDRQKFDQELRFSGLTENGYLNTLANIQSRNWLQILTSNNRPVSNTMAEATATFFLQKRVAKYFILPKSSIGSVEISNDEDLKKVYEENKTRFTVPEFRSVTLLKVDPKNFEDKVTVNDTQLKEYYDKNIKRFTTPGKRFVEQIPFSDEASANKAYARLQAGTSFKTIANEQGFESQDVALGNVSKNDIPDQVIAVAAFALGEGEISKPVKGQLSYMILRASQVVEKKVTSFEAAKNDIKQALVAPQLQELVENQHDAIEDARGEGMTFAEIAEKYNLTLQQVSSVNAKGFNAEGNDANLPKAEKSKLITGIFDSDVGLENDPINTARDGYIWYEVQDVKKPFLKSFEDAKDEVTKLALSIKKQKMLTEKASKLVEEAKKNGKVLSALASSVGAKIQTSRALKRTDAGDVFSSMTTASLFATPKNQIGWAQGISDIIIFKTEEVSEPKLTPDSVEIKNYKNGLAELIQADIGHAFISDLNKKFPIEQNNALWQSIQNGSYSPRH